MRLKRKMPGKFDAQLIPLLRELNNAGLKTIASCCGDNGVEAHITFDMKSFNSIIIDDKLSIYFTWRGK